MSLPNDDLVFAWEPLDILRDDGIEDIVRQEWEEVSVDRERMSLALDWDEYHSYEKLKIFRCMSCRRAGLLVGFNSFIVLPGHLHYRTTPHALNDAIYVVPTERGITGIQLLLEAEYQLKALLAPKAVRVVYYSKDDVHFGRKASTDGLDSLDLAAEAVGLMEKYNVTLPLSEPPISGTLGTLLEYIGYRRFETAYGKFIGD